MRGFDRCGVFSTCSSTASGKALERRFEGVLGGWPSDFRLREAWGGDLPTSVARRFSYSLYFAAFCVSVGLLSGEHTNAGVCSNVLSRGLLAVSLVVYFFPGLDRGTQLDHALFLGHD